MRIAQISPLYESVPPQMYGGTERVVHHLTEELVRMGHEVRLYASGDSTTSAELQAMCERATRLDETCMEPVARHVAMVEHIRKEAHQFDVVHNHVEWLFYPTLHNMTVPVLSTIHSRLDLPEMKAIYKEFREPRLVSISDAQRKPIPWARWVATVYHGLPADLYRPNYRRGDYLAFLGRFSPEKGPVAAIEIAKRAGIPLKMAAKVDAKDKRYYETEVLPRIRSSSLIEYIGEVGEKDKQELLCGALALLFPINWPEPFGLVMIEAMACGTPTIAFRCGSVPEIIDNGRNGYIVDTVEHAVVAVENIEKIDRHKCREAFDRRFTSNVMAKRYVQVYEKMCFAELGESAAVA